MSGIVRKIDELGRIVIPKEIRMIYDMKTRDEIEIFTTDEGVILRKYENRCVFCGSTGAKLIFMGKHICEYCRDFILTKEDIEAIDYAEVDTTNSNHFELDPIAMLNKISEDES